jgi:hypothetical protein
MTIRRKVIPLWPRRATVIGTERIGDIVTDVGADVRQDGNH